KYKGFLSSHIQSLSSHLPMDTSIFSSHQVISLGTHVVSPRKAKIDEDTVYEHSYDHPPPSLPKPIGPPKNVAPKVEVDLHELQRAIDILGGWKETEKFVNEI
ncbi:hypothetical protein PFISCL1PPCAC_7558, partial [Pristionchus fissidentatus]